MRPDKDPCVLNFLPGAHKENFRPKPVYSNTFLVMINVLKPLLEWMIFEGNMMFIEIETSPRKEGTSGQRCYRWGCY